MAELGHLSLLLALVVAMYAAVAALVGARRSYRELIASATNGIYATAGLATLAAVALLWSLLTHDFRLEYVYQYTSLDLPLPYTIAAFWAGQEGSLLLWTWLLALASAIAVWLGKNRHRRLIPYVIVTLATVQVFFFFLSVGMSDAFASLGWIPGDGHGLNPLLENPGMIIHPPAIFLGYVAFAIPFAYALAALASGRLGGEWVRATRSWALLSWLCLGLGNLLGAQWAYAELGWGGYWSWDAVENGSLLPWLTGTALLHSMIMQRRRGRFRVWNFVLATTTFGLAILGTFLVRGGLVSSVHSFAPSPIGSFFLAFLALVILASLVLIVVRLPQLRDSHPLKSPLSKESGFLLTNVILAALAFIVLWGTLYPTWSEAFFGRKVTLDPTFFNRATLPIFAVLLVLMGVCPLVRWQSNSLRSLLRSFRYPVALTILVTVALFAFGVQSWLALLAGAVCAFLILATGWRWARDLAARQRATKDGYLLALVALFWGNRPRYGAYIVHLGVALIALGVAGSSLFHAETSVALARGESTTIQGYTITYEGLNRTETADQISNTATIGVYQDGQFVDRMTSQIIVHRSYEQPVTEVGIRTTLGEDLYLILAGWEQNGEIATFKIMVNGLVVWLWIGAALLLAGGLIAGWPGPRTATASRASGKHRVHQPTTTEYEGAR